MEDENERIFAPSMKTESIKTLKMALPIILGNMSQMMLGVIDSAMIGAVDYKQLAASSLVINVLGIPYVAAIGITMSISPLVAIARGQSDTHKASHYLYNGVILSGIVGLLIALLLQVGNGLIFRMGQDPEVAQMALPYLEIMGWSTIPMILFLALKQFTDALEHTKVAMVLSLLSLPINVFLNWVMIYGKFGFPRMELEGAGIATLITRVIVFIALFWTVFKSPLFKEYIAVKTSAWKLKMESINDLLRIGIPSSLQYGMEVGAFSVSGILIGWFGATQQAAHQIALNCAAMTFMFALGVSQAGSIRISHAMGQGLWEKVRKIGVGAVWSSTIFGLLFALLLIIFHQQLPIYFNENPAVIEIAATLLLFAAVFQVSDATQAVGVGLLRGITDVRVPTLLVAIAYWVIGLPLGCLLGFYFKLESMGMWIGFVTGLSISSILLNTRFLKMVARNQSLKSQSK